MKRSEGGHRVETNKGQVGHGDRSIRARGAARQGPASARGEGLRARAGRWARRTWHSDVRPRRCTQHASGDTGWPLVGRENPGTDRRQMRTSRSWPTSTMSKRSRAVTSHVDARCRPGVPLRPIAPAERARRCAAVVENRCAGHRRIARLPQRRRPPQKNGDRSSPIGPRHGASRASGGRRSCAGF